MAIEAQQSVSTTDYEKEFKEVTGKNFNIYYNKYFVKLTYYIKRYGINELDAEGLAHDAFMKSLKKIQQYNPKYAFSTWLFNIAKNETLQHINKNKKSILVDYNQEQDDEFTSTQNSLKYYINTTISDDEIEIREQNIVQYKYNETLKEIQKLEPKYRHIILMREVENMSYDDIKDELGISLQTVKNRIHHGRKKLHEKLIHKFEEYLNMY